MSIPPAQNNARSLFLRYGVALASAALAVLLREALTPLWQDQLPFLTLFPAVMISVWYGGLGPGLVTTALCALAAAYLWLAPFYPLSARSLADQVGLGLAVLVMLLITWLTAALRWAQEQLAHQVHQVRARTVELTQTNAELREESAARQRAEQHLKERVEELETLLDLLPVAVWIGHDPANTHITGNRASYELLRMPLGSNISASASPTERPNHFKIYGADGTRLHPADLPMQYAGIHGVAVTSSEFLYRFADGTETYVYGGAKPLFDTQGQVRGSLAVFLDITARKEAEKVLARHARKLERANADLRQIAYITAHDLQEPVRQVGIYTQKVAERYRDSFDLPTSEAVDFIVAGTQRMIAQFTDLMHYLEVDEANTERTTTDCEVVLQNALLQVREPIAASNATITHDPLPTIKAHPAHLQLVFQELLDNAVKFRTTAPPQVHVWAEREERRWRFAVRDHGISIDPQYYGRLFGLFKRIERDRYPGTGMGLAICKKIVERHGGGIWLEPTSGGGVTVMFTISDVEEERRQ